MTKINPGDTAYDIYTGLRGAVITRSEFLYGCERLTIQPKGKDENGAPLNAYVFDEQRVKLVKAGPRQVQKKPAYGLGDTVRDKLNGYQGIVTARYIHYGNIIEYNVEPVKLKEDGTPQDGAFLVEDRVELVKSAKPEVSSNSTARTGGPQNDRIRSTTKRKP